MITYLLDVALESMRDGLVDLINKKPEFNDVITVESGFGIGDILITSKSKTDGLFEISVSEEANSKDLSIINASSSGIVGAIRAVNEGLTGLPMWRLRYNRRCRTRKLLQ